MSMCGVFSCVVERGCLLRPVHSLGRTLLAFVLLHSVLQGQIYLLLQVFLDFLLLHSRPLWWKGHLFFWVLVLKGLVGLHRTVQFSFFNITGWVTDLDFRDIEWFALEMNRDHFFHFWDCIQLLHVKLFCVTVHAEACLLQRIMQKGGWEDLPHIQGQGQRLWVTIPHPRSGALAERIKPISKEWRLRWLRRA